MRASHRYPLAAVLFGSLLVPLTGRAGPSSDDVNLLSWGAGAMVVQAPPSYSDSGNWSPMYLLDELPATGWATKSGDLSPKVFVLELADRSEITSLAFDTAQVENRGRSAKDLRVEISDRKDSGFVEIARPSLAPMKDQQTFALKAPARGRYLRLTALNNWGDEKYIEIMNVFAYGRPLVKTARPNSSGTFSSSYGKFHLRQSGPSVTGCYEHSNGLIENGGFEGRVLRFTWTEGEIAGPRQGGPAMMIFADDGKSFVGYWWHEGNTQGEPGEWNGTKISDEIGACPYWKPGAGDEVVQQLKSQGRARLYGILFDTDSDHLRDESKPALESLLAAARNEPSWRFAIQGYTDDTGSASHNQVLSERRALAVKEYLVGAGVDGARLSSQGFGASKPVSSNDTALGRSQNRRVEIVRE